MLYTQGFVLAGTLATAIALAAVAELPARPGRSPEPRPAPGAGDLRAIGLLRDAVDAHTFRRGRLREPDADIAVRAREAAELAEGRVRETLLDLADSASRSALEFLVDYNLTAGGWELATGMRMPAAAPAAA
jgi:hypothetical protein